MLAPLVSSQRPNTSRSAGVYQLHVTDSPPLAGYGSLTYVHVYRNGVLVTQVRARSPEAALAEARRNVRLARKCGGL